jgi:O-acetyl-ADP-ribose deacetylase (regulator of RNase III)
MAQGDIFEANVESIVNSEQTDFVLASNSESISGQISERFGQIVQPELDLATNMDVFRAGTVISTSGGDLFKRIYHAGIHEPHDWPGGSSGLTHAQLLGNIGTCLDQILQMAATDGMTSVAFPLIGCGLLGLDERMLVLQFLHALEQFDRRCTDEKFVHVWLVINDQRQTASVLNHLIGQLIEHREQTVTISIQQTGIPILDRYGSNLCRRSDANWAKWQLCRFTEIALEIMCFGLCRVSEPAVTPESLFKEGMAATFGVVRGHAIKFSTMPREKLKDGWGANFFASVLRNEESVSALETLNTQRNNLAHGRETMSVGQIRELTLQSLQLKDWEKIQKTDGELRLTDWIPWVVAPSSAPGKAGLFERWQKNAIRYLVPETGEIFKVPRTST